MSKIEIAGLVVHEAVVDHPLLGKAQIIEHQGRELTAMSVIDWERPTRIPTVAEPRRLPRGTGSVLINEIARRAKHAGVPALRYAGPYPTYALFKTLSRSFRAMGECDEFEAHVLRRAMTLARDEVPIDFEPAPFDRITTPTGFIDLRDGVERAQIDGVLYDEDGTAGSIAHLRRNDTGWTAQLSIGHGFELATIAKLDSRGAITDGPHAIPPFTGACIGKVFPPELCVELAGVVANAAPAPLADDVRAVMIGAHIEWADLGWRSAARTDAGFAVHAALWEVLGRRHLGQFTIQLGAGLAHVITNAIVDELVATVATATN